MKPVISEIRQILEKHALKKNENFFKMMVPGQQRVYGVKTPVLNEIAKKYQEGSFVLAKALWKSGALEERIIAIKIIEKKGKTDPARVLELLKEFSASIDNWAVCDGLGMQFIRGIVKTHAKEIFGLAKIYSRSKDPWRRRLSLVMVEWYTRQPEYHAAIRELVKFLENDEAYYVKKAVAWIHRNLDRKK